MEEEPEDDGPSTIFGDLPPEEVKEIYREISGRPEEGSPEAGEEEASQAARA